MSLSAEDKKEIAEIVQREINRGWTDEERDELRDAVRRMMEMQLDFNAVGQFLKTQPGYEPGDERAPFFSEAFLYPLLGKDDARTVRAVLKRVIKSTGLFKQEELWRL